MKKAMAFRLLLAAVFIGSIFFAPLRAHAERLEYSYGWTMVLPNVTSAYDAAIDSNNNFYLTGYYQNTVDFDPGPGTDEYTSVGNTVDIFLTKYDADRNYQWTRVWGGTGTFDHPHQMAFDDSDNIYVIGQFQNTVDFDPGPGTDERTSAGNYDGFLTKYSPDGTYQWARTWGGTGIDYPEALVFSSAGTLYLGGRFSDTVDFDPGPGTDNKTSAGSQDAFLTEIDTDGNYIATKTWGGTGFDSASYMAIDANDNLFIGGPFNGTVDFDPGPGTDERTSALNSDVYIVKYDDQGTYEWVRTWGGENNDLVFNISFDKDNNVYVGGYYRDTVDFDPGPGTDERTSSDDTNDSYLSKFTNAGTFVWVKTWGGEGSEQVQPGVVFDSDGKMYVPNYFESPSIDLDPGPGEDIVANPETEWSGDFALSIFDAEGNYDSALLWQSTGYETTRRVFKDSHGSIYLTGATSATSIDFNPYAGDDVRSLPSGYKAFLTKLTATHYQHGTVKSGLKVTHPASGNDVTKHAEGVERSASVALRLDTDTGTPLADFTADMSTDRDWSSISGSSDSTNYKSVVSGLAGADGVNGTHSLYVPKKDTDTAVHICPDAQTLEQVTTDCSNGQTYTENDSNVSVVEVNGASYWLVSGLSGTGGMSTTGELVDTGEGNTSAILLLATVIVLCGGFCFAVTARQ